MKSFANILWLVLGGALIALLYWIAGLVICITIIGIPWGMQHFKMALAAIFPFGKEIR